MGRPLPKKRSQQHETAPVPSEMLPPTGGSDAESEEVARLAYQYWEQHSRPAGTQEEDWFRAEEEIKVRQQKQAK